MPSIPAQFLPLALLLAPAVDGWLGIYLAADQTQAVVAEVIPDSPAHKAGLQAGDVLLAVGDRATPTQAEFIAAVRAGKPGDQLRLRLRRGDRESTAVVRLGERPAAADTGGGAGNAPPRGAAQRPGQPGPESAPAPERLAPRAPAAGGRGYLGIGVEAAEGGVVVTRVLPDSPAAAAGIRTGERIAAVGAQKIAGLADLDQVLERAAAGTELELTLRSAEGVRTLRVRLGTIPGPVRGGAEAPVAPRDVVPPAPEAAPEHAELQRELEALRQELRELRRQVEALREARGGGRE